MHSRSILFTAPSELDLGPLDDRAQKVNEGSAAFLLLPEIGNSGDAASLILSLCMFASQRESDTG